MVTMDESFNLRLGAIFIIFVVSLVGFFLPYYLVTNGFRELDSNIYFLNLKSFASGIILSVAMIHLLAESASTLSTYTSYPCKYHKNYNYVN
jgi:hypothetical protein